MVFISRNIVKVINTSVVSIVKLSRQFLNWTRGIEDFKSKNEKIRGMPTGPKVFLAVPDACGLRPRDHLKKALCQICPVVGRMINTKVVLLKTYLSSSWVAFGRPCWPRHGYGRVCLGTGDFLRPQGTFPLALTPFAGVRFIA